MVDECGSDLIIVKNLPYLDLITVGYLPNRMDVLGRWWLKTPDNCNLMLVSPDPIRDFREL